jgi:hypothetical protein
VALDVRIGQESPPLEGEMKEEEEEEEEEKYETNSPTRPASPSETDLTTSLSQTYNLSSAATRDPGAASSNDPTSSTAGTDTSSSHSSTTSSANLVFKEKVQKARTKIASRALGTKVSPRQTRNQRQQAQQLAQVQEHQVVEYQGPWTTHHRETCDMHNALDSDEHYDLNTCPGEISSTLQQVVLACPLSYKMDDVIDHSKHETRKVNIGDDDDPEIIDSVICPNDNIPLCLHSEGYACTLSQSKRPKVTTAEGVIMFVWPLWMSYQSQTRCGATTSHCGLQA